MTGGRGTVCLSALRERARASTARTGRACEAGEEEESHVNEPSRRLCSMLSSSGVIGHALVIKIQQYIDNVY